MKPLLSSTYLQVKWLLIDTPSWCGAQLKKKKRTWITLLLLYMWLFGSTVRTPKIISSQSLLGCDSM
jgi:hypothetical protein